MEICFVMDRFFPVKHIMGHRISLLAACVFVTSANYAQLDLNALKRQSESNIREQQIISSSQLENRLSSWDGFISDRLDKWEDVIAKRDNEWVSFLDGEWTMFDDFLVSRPDPSPKPDIVPVAPPAADPQAATPTKQPEPITVPDNSVPSVGPDVSDRPVPVDVPENHAAVPVPVCKEPPSETPHQGADKPSFTFQFYGSSVTVPADTEIRLVKVSKPDNHSISQYWKELSAKDYSQTVRALLQEKDKRNLNDYAYYLLVKSFSSSFITGGLESSTLFTWFLLVRSGYDVRVGYNAHGPVLMAASQQMMFNTKYLMTDGTKYFVLSENGSNEGIYSYNGSYAQGKPLDFTIGRPMTFSGKAKSRELNFEFNGKQHDFILDFDPDFVSYSNDIPQLDFEVYFNSQPSEPANSSIVRQLKPAVAGMDELTAVNFLLSFVQHAFEYKTDNQQFGREKYFYAEEVLAYPYCDCEDRSVFFSYLVRNLLGLEVVGLEFPGHMATAVQLRQSTAEGTIYNISGKRYTIADPTYIGAKTGHCMPDYIHTTPTVIPIR